MRESHRKPRPVPVRRYRYSKWRWRLLVHVIDAVGRLLMLAWRLFRPVPQRGIPERVLIVQLDHLGDAVLSGPLIDALRAAYPGARIDVLASLSNHAVFQADPQIDRVHLAERNWFERRPGRWALVSALFRLGWRLRKERYDLGIDVRGDVVSVALLVLAGIARRVGWAMGGGGFLLTDVVPWVPGRHEVPSRLAILDALGLPRPATAHVRIALTERDRAWALGRLGGPEAAAAPLLAAHLGAGTAAKRWPTGHWRDLIARFVAEGWRVVVVGGPEDQHFGRSLRDLPGLLDLSGRLSVTETAAILERSDLFLGADSGPAHLAACVGVPSVVLFSGTNRDRQWRPWSRQTLVVGKAVSCRPCHQKVCPLAEHPCMTGLTPDRVYRAARRWLARSPRRLEAQHVPV